MRVKRLDLADLPDVECRGCDKGIRFCSQSRPCWGTPEDIGRLLDAGMADQLMLDWHAKGAGVDYYVVSPASRGMSPLEINDGLPMPPGLPMPTGVHLGSFGGMVAPGLKSHELSGIEAQFGILAPLIAGLRQELGMSLLNTGCVFLTGDDLCGLHDRGLKPMEGRKSCCKNGTGGEGMALHNAVDRTWDSEEGRAVVARWRELTGCEGTG